jgi:hypothetical protein
LQTYQVHPCAESITTARFIILTTVCFIHTMHHRADASQLVFTSLQKQRMTSEYNDYFQFMTDDDTWQNQDLLCICTEATNATTVSAGRLYYP